MKLSRLFKSLVTVHGNGPEEYLKLTKSCMERVQRLTSLSGFISLKFNHGQCKYLADKLKLAVKSADSFLVLLSKRYFWFPSPEDKASCLKIFKLLYASAKEVENFIQSQCSKDAWIQAAMSSTNVSEYVLSIGFNLELWTLVFSKSEKLRARRSFTLTKVDAVFKAEAKIVKERALRDRDLLLRNVNSVLQTKKPTSIEYQLAGLLRERLEANRLIPAGDLPGSSHSDLSSETVFNSEEQVKQLGDTVFRSLKVKDQLGKGAAATVNRAYWMGGEAAIKTFFGPDNNDFKKEVAILRKLSHPNIISLLCSNADERSCSIVVELMDGDLSSLMHKRFLEGLGNQESPFDIMEGVDIMLQVGGGMQYLHDMKIVHRDLKSMNILVRCVGAQEIEYVVAKVADFGLSKTKERSMTYSNQTLNLGTTRWMAPEMIQSFNAESEVEMSESKATVMNYPFKSDIYSFGMLCFEILTGHVPFSDVPAGSVRKLVVSGGRPPLPSQCPPLLKSLIERCWNQDPSKRPSFGEICAELRHLKCELLMPSALGEVSLSVNIPERPSASNSSTPIGFKRRGYRVQWLVALDFGTTYSGFAYYANVSTGGQMCVNNDYPYYYGEWTPRGSSSGRGVVENPYCKTLTASFYARGLSRGQHKRPSWGYHAQHDYLANVEGLYLTTLKSKSSLFSRLNDLPSWAARESLTVDSVITDYLKYIGELALSAIETARKSEPASFDRDSVLWCVSVPSIWDENAKQQMREYMVNAGLVSGEGGPESVMLVQETEAASFHCHQLLVSDHQSLRTLPTLLVRDKVLVVDIGGRTVDVVVQEVIRSGNNFKVQELTAPSVGRCGGTSVDASFMKFLSRRIGCLDEFLREEDRYRWRLLMEWEDIKCGFGHQMMSSTDTMNITLHNILLPEKWEEYEMERGYPRRESYSKIELTQQDLKSIFDPVVDKILGLIETQLSQVQSVKVMFVVGGFAGSPYVMERIRARFCHEVDHIFSPPNPGSAIMQGAIALALTPDAIAQAVTPDAIVPRILMKTYGITMFLPFEHGVDPSHLLEVKGGKQFCRNRFVPIFVKECRIEGKQVARLGPFDVPHTCGQTQIPLELYSSSEQEPRYTFQDSVTREGHFVINLLEDSNFVSLIDENEVGVTVTFKLHLCRSKVELRAVATVKQYYDEVPHSMELPQVFTLSTCIANIF
ncbi:hypothetical protein M758_12G086300 [Ceratodon purpureus]|nr:hypothetical protein M758_12G086300 [Ceratodon purpureus]